MSEPRVCDITVIMRARLACGLYNHRSVPPRWRPLARAYCVALPIAISFFFFSNINYLSFIDSLFSIPSFFLYYLSILVSLWTGDEYIYKYFSQNNLTDVTLDSRNIFSRLQKQLKQSYRIWFAFWLFIIILPTIPIFKKVDTVFIGLYFLVSFIDQVLVLSSFRVIIMGLFDARLLVLKRRLQRYGFRAVGRAQPQPYCQVYDEILRGLDETDQPLKLLLFFDIICTCCKFISVISVYTMDPPWKNLNFFERSAIVINLVKTLFQQFFVAFGCVGYLESGSAHCNDMAVFTVTQLIKAPTAEERRQMRDFVAVLELHRARYKLLRAVPLDARFVLRVLAFCTAQIFVIIASVWNKNN